jgi:hypothetical protein
MGLADNSDKKETNRTEMNKKLYIGRGVILVFFILTPCFLMGCKSGRLQPAGHIETKSPDEPHPQWRTIAMDREKRNELVSLDSNAQAPPPPGIGVSISLGQEINPAIFKKGQPVILHGSFNADMDLIKICRQGVENSILLTLIATDRPWGETTRLIEPQIQSERPPIDKDTPYDPTYREGGQFKVDLVKFFNLPETEGKYTISASVGPYFSTPLDFDIKSAD